MITVVLLPEHLIISMHWPYGCKAKLFPWAYAISLKLPTILPLKLIQFPEGPELVGSDIWSLSNLPTCLISQYKVTIVWNMVQSWTNIDLHWCTREWRPMHNIVFFAYFQWYLDKDLVSHTFNLFYLVKTSSNLALSWGCHPLFELMIRESPPMM